MTVYSRGFMELCSIVIGQNLALNFLSLCLYAKIDTRLLNVFDIRYIAHRSARCSKIELSRLVLKVFPIG